MDSQSEKTIEVNLRVVLRVQNDVTAEQVAKAVESVCTGTEKPFASAMWEIGQYDDSYVTTVDEVTLITSKSTVYRGD